MDASEAGGPSAEWGWRGGQSRFSGQARDLRLWRALRRLERELGAGALPDFAWSALQVIRAPAAGASADQIAEAELRLGTTIPDDYTRFLTRWNGLTLLIPPAPGRLGRLELCLLGTEALVLAAEALAAAYPGACIPEVLRFATVGSEGDGLAFATGRRNPLGGCAVLDAPRDRHPEQWWVIARDFTAWLQELLRPGRAAASLGRDWGEELQLLLPFDEIGPGVF